MDFADAVFERHPQTIMGTMAVRRLDTPKDEAGWARLKAQELAAFKEYHSAYERKNALSQAPLSCYGTYYKQFKKTYPVLLQMESVLLKGRGVDSPCTAVETMFLAEVKHGLLVAGHDAEKLSGGYSLRVAEGGETFTVVTGKERTLKTDDLYIADGEAILSSVLEGQDYASRLTGSSTAAVYCAYGLCGVTVQQMQDFFADLAHYITTAYPQAVVSPPRIMQAVAS
ncbi:phenylalanine--tRNA ligase beta subunit-related protein [Oleidesulfovibrio sp.]|uniref:phenylalanine--tRNA ligase beta subunit-related protein n=1 Tax=Oleidesulfovibrio sp. TaxID=2909707 RepID=UPI003A8B2F54